MADGSVLTDFKVREAKPGEWNVFIAIAERRFAQSQNKALPDHAVKDETDTIASRNQITSVATSVAITTPSPGSISDNR